MRAAGAVSIGISVLFACPATALGALCVQWHPPPHASVGGEVRFTFRTVVPLTSGEYRPTAVRYPFRVVVHSSGGGLTAVPVPVRRTLRDHTLWSGRFRAVRAGRWRVHILNFEEGVAAAAEPRCYRPLTVRVAP
jgi:hypothetical protein